MYSNNSGAIFVIVVLGGLIALAVYLIKRSGDELRRSEQMYIQIAQQLSPDKQPMFLIQFNSLKKNPTVAVLLALFLGGLGIHRFYVGQTGLGVLYLLFFWTGIPALIAVIDAFTISGRVGKYNQRKALETGMLLGASNLGNFITA